MGAATSSTAPVGAQIALINTDMPCLRSGPGVSGYTSQIVTASITAPLSAGAGQGVFFSDLTGTIAVPDWVQSSSHYKLDYTVTFDTTNEPNARALGQQSFSVSGSTFSPTSQPARYPSQGVYQPLGPVTIGAQGTTTDFRLANLTYTYTPSNANGDSLSSPYTLQCGRTPLFSDNYPRYIVASTTSDAAVDSNKLRPANGVPGAFPPTGFREKSIIANLTIDCAGSTLVPSAPYSLAITGTGPTITQAGQTINLKQWNQVFTVPYQAFGPLMTRGNHEFIVLTDTAKDGSDNPGPGIFLTAFNGNPWGFDISRDWKSASAGADRPLRSSKTVNLPTSGRITDNIVFPLPAQGGLTLPDITTSDAYKVFSASVANFQAKFSIREVATGFRPGGDDLKFTCAVKANQLFRVANVY